MGEKCKSLFSGRGTDSPNFQLFKTNNDKAFRQYQEHKHFPAVLLISRSLSPNLSNLSEFDHIRRFSQVFPSDRCKFWRIRANFQRKRASQS